MNMYEMPLRSYDPALARWTTIDPVTHYSTSTYNGFDNNPVFWSDPSGGNAQITNYGVTFTGVDAVSAFNAYFESLESGEGRFTLAGIITVNAGPGARYMSPDLAALDFAMAYNGVSIINNLELSSAIYKGKYKGGDYFSYTTPIGYVEFGKDGKRLPSNVSEVVTDVPPGTIKVGDIHTHGAEDGKNINKFSPQDMDGNYNRSKDIKGYVAYVATPNGTLWKYTPFAPGIKTLTTKLSTGLPSDPSSTSRNQPFVSPNVVPQVMPTILSSDINFTSANLKLKYKN